ncbi:hypothetical protein GCM10017562_01870 [Streptomyces roseofulvus]
MLAPGATLGLVQLPLIAGVQATVPYEEKGRPPRPYCSAGRSARASARPSSARSPTRSSPRGLDGTAGDLDALARALDAPTSLTAEAANRLRRAVEEAVVYVYVGAAAAAAAAALMLLTLLALAPRRCPVLKEAAGEDTD